MFEYRGTVLTTLDGDTVELDLDLGLDVHVRTRARLLGINAPEIHTKNAAEKKRGLAARDRLSALVAEQALTVRTTKDKREKYGRYLVDLIREDGANVAIALLNEGLVKPWNGKGARPV